MSPDDASGRRNEQSDNERLKRPETRAITDTYLSWIVLSFKLFVDTKFSKIPKCRVRHNTTTSLKVYASGHKALNQRYQRNQSRKVKTTEMSCYPWL